MMQIMKAVLSLVKGDTVSDRGEVKSSGAANRGVLRAEAVVFVDMV
jgi:hypothetical protein